MCYGHLGINHKSPDYQDILISQVSLDAKASFGTISKCMDYMQVALFSSVLINRLHHIMYCGQSYRLAPCNKGIVLLLMKLPHIIMSLL